MSNHSSRLLVLLWFFVVNKHSSISANHLPSQRAPPKHTLFKHLKCHKNRVIQLKFDLKLLFQSINGIHSQSAEWKLSKDCFLWCDFFFSRAKQWIYETKLRDKQNVIAESKATQKSCTDDLTVLISLLAIPVCLSLKFQYLLYFLAGVSWKTFSESAEKSPTLMPIKELARAVAKFVSIRLMTWNMPWRKCRALTSTDVRLKSSKLMWVY